MLDTILLMAFCLVAGLVSMGVGIYLLATGQIFTLDGIALAMISVTIGALFLLNVGWSVYTGELRRIIDAARQKSGDSSQPPSAAGSS